jgi:hypothetical protein
MILIASGEDGAAGFAAQIDAAVALAALGHRPVIEAQSLPPAPTRGQLYQSAILVADAEDLQGRLTAAIVLGADRISPAALDGLARLPLSPDARVVGTGWFAAPETRAAAARHLAFAFGRAAQLVDLGALVPGDAAARPLLPPLHALDATATAATADRPRILLAVAGAELDLPETLPALAALAARHDLRLSLLVDGPGKDRILASRHHALPLATFDDLHPWHRAAHHDLLVLGASAPCAEGDSARWAAAFIARGRVVIDARPRAAAGPDTGAMPLLRGPETLDGLASYLTGTVLPNRAAIATHVMGSDWRRDHDIARLIQAAGLKPSARAPRPDAARGRAVFVATNGVGLGHAQRALQIAQSLTDPARAAFAVFPSCTGLVAARGFPVLPLVPRGAGQPAHPGGDLVNHRRLSGALGPRDVVVYDGGYIPQSLHLAIMERQLRAIWVRRGLWKPARGPLPGARRAEAFARTIVPAEALPELNDPAWLDDGLDHVGPIVAAPPAAGAAAADAAALRARLATALDRDFDRLVVSMPGAGVADTRVAHLQTIAALVEPRADVLHLIVAWPGSRIAPVLLGWHRSAVVQTVHAADLAAAADVVVSAAGYNSVHELLYRRVPAILLPQTSMFLDDQDRRARAMADRGLALNVGPDALLALERAVRGMLDDATVAAGIARRLAACDLPAPGNAAAAAIIDKALQP